MKTLCFKDTVLSYTDGLVSLTHRDGTPLMTATHKTVSESDNPHRELYDVWAEDFDTFFLSMVQQGRYPSNFWQAAARDYFSRE